MAEVKKKKKNDRRFELKWDVLLGDSSDDDDRLFITSKRSSSSSTQTQDYDYQMLTDVQLSNKISKFKALINTIGPKTNDNGHKLEANLRRLEAEHTRRKVFKHNPTIPSFFLFFIYICPNADARVYTMSTLVTSIQN